MIVVGLTGSIAMGKTEAARMFAARGIPVFDSDAAVHHLYAHGGAAVDNIAKIVPPAVVDGTVNRHILATELLKTPELLKLIENAVHPLVRNMQDRFLQTARETSIPFVILDIPLLFETGRQNEVDKIIVVSAPPAIQRARALSRPAMTENKLDLVLSRQTPDPEKRQMADYVIDTSGQLDDTARQIDHIIEELWHLAEGYNDT